MPAVECLLIRHAQSQPAPDVAEDDWPLSELGRRQADELRDRLAARGLEELYSSPYPRAAATLRPLAERLGLELRLVPELRERRLAWPPLASWREALRASWADFEQAHPGGESSRACQARIRSAVLGILARSRASRIAIASHGNAIGLLLQSMEPSFGYDEWARMRNPEIFRLSWDGLVLAWDRDGGPRQG